MKLFQFSILKRATAALTLSAVFGLFILTPTGVEASSEGARAAARILLRTLAINDWNVRDQFSWGLLDRGDSITIRTTLHAGNSYKLVAAGCEDAYDVDIRVYDENGNFIDGDGDSSRVAVADVSPAWSGTFLVKITMYNSTPNGAHWVLQYAYQND